jgi:hypothetical protein
LQEIKDIGLQVEHTLWRLTQKEKYNMQYRVIKMLRATFQAQREKALMTFELLTENPAGIGDHSTEDFYKNAEEAAKALAEADDVLDTLERYFPE